MDVGYGVMGCGGAAEGKRVVYDMAVATSYILGP